jgi:alginate O-acetyltransferase complex protein AlgI
VSGSWLLLFAVALPVAMCGAAVLRRLGKPRVIPAWLSLVSLIFYAAFGLLHAAVLLASAGGNYLLAKALIRQPSRVLLGSGIAFNILLVASLKLMALGTAEAQPPVAVSMSIVPMGLSFLALLQIAFLIDIYRREIRHVGFQQYGLFVSFFPRLLAGPVVRYRPFQNELDRLGWPTAAEFRMGLVLISIGLFKKVVLADGLAPLVAPTFRFASSSLPITFFDAWTAAVAFSLQIYFDLSGYADLAIGVSLLFGVRLPLNFASPYRARSMIEFWRRWHISWSSFFRHYVEAPLRGRHAGSLQSSAAILATMIIAGLWHGPALLLVAWGAVHGIYLIANHAFRAAMKLSWTREMYLDRLLMPLTTVLVFPAVTFAWMLFRAESWSGAALMSRAMLGYQGVVVPEYFQAMLGPLRGPLVKYFNIHTGNIVMFGQEDNLTPLLFLLFCAGICFFLPNSQSIVGYNPTHRSELSSASLHASKRSEWPLLLQAALGVGLIAWTIKALLGGLPGDFIYFRF